MSNKLHLSTFTSALFKHYVGVQSQIPTNPRLLEDTVIEPVGETLYGHTLDEVVEFGMSIQQGEVQVDSFTVTLTPVAENTITLSMVRSDIAQNNSPVRIEEHRNDVIAIDDNGIAFITSLEVGNPIGIQAGMLLMHPDSTPYYHQPVLTKQTRR